MAAIAPPDRPSLGHRTVRSRSQSSAFSSPLAALVRNLFVKWH
ncbi:hypothetical protein [Oxynema sp. CENA135]|nr:hypothetical protein [Oxynema sp. CENA135]